MNLDLLLEQAKEELCNLHVNEKFVLKDLFKGYEWNRLKQGEKSTLGTLFFNYVQSDSKIEITQKNNGLREYKVVNWPDV